MKYNFQYNNTKVESLVSPKVRGLLLFGYFKSSAAHCLDESELVHPSLVVRGVTQINPKQGSGLGSTKDGGDNLGWGLGG